MSNTNSKIDVVITWVDASDPKWRRDYKKYYKKAYGTDAKLQSFQDIGTLRYLFRGIEKFMPWVNRIHLVTYGHYPKWLNLSHSKLQLVSHKEIFEDPTVLPVFNSHAIEMNLSNIPHLQEKFIYFNDDMLILKKVKPSRFFEKDLPNDFMIFSPMIFNTNGSKFYYALYNDMALIHSLFKGMKHSKWLLSHITKIFNIKYSIKWNIRNMLALIIPFQLFKLYHFPQPYLKSSYSEARQIFKKNVQITSQHKFRSPYDINQYFFRFYNLVAGKFNPYKPMDTYWAPIYKVKDLDTHIQSLLKGKGKYAFVCFNESVDIPLSEYSLYRNKLNRFLSSILPNKSTFEK